MLKKIVKKITPSPLLGILYQLYKLIIYRTSPKQTKPDKNLDCLAGMIAYNKFGGYCLPLNSIQRPALQATLRGVVWEQQTVEFMRENNSGGDIIHAGTYFGDFLPGLSQSCDHNAFIWAFEPNPQNHRCAEITCLINGLDNVNLHNAGLGQTDTLGVMNTIDSQGRSMGGSSTIIDDDSEMDAAFTQSVKIVSLDSVVPKSRHISLLQLDVEGYEKQALLGGMDIIKRCSPILILENPLPDSLWLEEHIFSLGYSVTGQVQGNSILQNLR